MFNLRLKRERTELHALDVPDFVAGRLSNAAESERKKLKSSLEEIKKEFYSLKILVTELGEKSTSHAFSNTVKNNYVAKSSKLIDDVVFEIEKSSSYDSIRRCDDTITASLGDISSLRMKELRHLYAFKADMDKISNQVKLLMKRHKDFQNLFQSCTAISDFSSIEASASTIRESLEKVDRLGSEIVAMNEKMLGLEKEFQREKNELIRLESDPSVENAEKELKMTEKEKSIIRQRIATELGGVERILRKFLHSGVEMGAEDLALSEEYIKNTENAFINDNNLSIKKILYEIISLDALDKKEKEKASDMIRTASVLVSLRNEYIEMSKKSDVLKNDENLYRILAETRQHREKLKDIERSLSVINNEIDRKIHEKTRIEMDMMKDRKMLEGMLARSLGREITIRLD